MESHSDSQNSKSAEALSRQAGLALRRDLLAVLCANSAFLLLLLVADLLPMLVYLGCVVFLLIGFWVGRRSLRPWVDGAIYGGLSTLVAAVLIALVTDMGWFGWLAALFLALPQGVVGVWLGAQLLGRRWQ
jgi:hypothetical protein